MSRAPISESVRVRSKGQVLFKFRYCTSVRGFEKQTITKLARIGVGKSAGRNGYITSYYGNPLKTGAGAVS